jgi:hypothetical protein
MPQFDTIIYLTFFITFLSYSVIIYFIISLFFVPLFWNIYYFRYLKKENNSFFSFIYFKNLQQFKNLIINYNLKSQLSLKNSLNIFKFSKISSSLFFIFVNLLIKFILKIK